MRLIKGKRLSEYTDEEAKGFPPHLQFIRKCQLDPVLKSKANKDWGKRGALLKKLKKEFEGY